MGSWWRSRDMKYVSLIVSEDAAHECVHQLGQLGALQLTDLNPDLTPFQRRYVGYIKRCEELERKLRYMEKEISGFGLRIADAPSSAGGLTAGMSSIDKRTGAAILDALEADLERFEEQLLELNNYSKELTTRYNEKIEYQECLEKGKAFFEQESAGTAATGGAYQGGSAGTLNPVLGAAGHHHVEADASASLLGDEVVSFGAPPGAAASSHRAVEVDMKFSSTIGVVSSTEKARFERMLFRSTRGNCLARFAEVERPIADAATGAPEKKMVFVVFYKSEVIGSIVDKICQAFGARQYPVPDHTQPGDAEKLDALSRETLSELADAREVLLKNRELRLALCSRLAHKYGEWKGVVTKEKAAYHALNLFKADVAGMLRGEGWIVASAEAEARALVQRAHAAVDLAGASMLAPVPTPWPTPPTYFETNAFTYAYQEFVDTYGVPRYKEINPALFTAVTFPFLFGMMYGDVGHGSCVFLGGLYLVLSYPSFAASKTSDEMLGGLYSARFMLTMMGLFAVYCGFCYNDFFGLPLDAFGASYPGPSGSAYFWENINYKHATTSAAKDENDPEEMRTAVYSWNKAPFYDTDSYGRAEKVYPFGVDPAWHVSENELLFFNSMKMKTAVIVGVIQMTGGILLKGVNAIYFGERVVFLLEFIPMIIFDLALFGYMVILIFTKWAIDWNERQAKGTCFYYPSVHDAAYSNATRWRCADGDAPCVDYSGNTCLYTDDVGDLCEKSGLEFGGTSNGCVPPNLINQLINIALAPGSVDEPMYDNQGTIQSMLLVIAFLCVPVLLLGKPAYVYMSTQHAPQPAAGSTQIEMHHGGQGTDLENLNGDHGDEHDDEEHSFTEVFIHQCIETIEFVLGMVSNTASYLRLWALSLAHSELAQVFWEKTLRSALTPSPNAVAIFIAYAIFAAVTMSVLLAMDLLECFLHALRLHWVEFQSKFYKADGYKFKPFSFAALKTGDKAD